MANLRDRMYWRGSPREPVADPAAKEAALRKPLTKGQVELREEFLEKMKQIKHMRVKERGHAHNVSMPQISWYDMLKNPEEVRRVLDAYILIEIFKLKQKARKLRAWRKAYEENWGQVGLKYTRSGTLIVDSNF